MVEGMTDKLASNPVDEILRLHEEIGTAYKTSLEKAIRIGELLTEQKAALKHGEFGPWIRESLPFTDQTARNYMKVFVRKDEFKSKTVLNLADAYRLLPPKNARRAFLSSSKPESKSKTVLNLTSDSDDLPSEPESKSKTVLNLTSDSDPDDLPSEEDLLPPPPDLDGEDEELERDLPQASGDAMADVMAAVGIAPVNAPLEYEIPKTTRVKAQALTDLEGPALVKEMTSEEAMARRPGYAGPPPKPSPDGVARVKLAPEPPKRESDEDFERYMSHDDIVEEDDDPLPTDWVDILTEVRTTNVPEERVTAALQTLLEKVRAKYAGAAG